LGKPAVGNCDRQRPGNGLPRRTYLPKRNRLPVSSLKLGAKRLLDDAMAKVSPFKFMQEVRAEAQKVTWPTRKETTVTTIMVFVMVFIACIFFLLADQLMRVAVSFLLGIST
jgi:preprotein translocase subunit SecE